MSRREIIAYAITRAPPGVKGGPYEAESGPPGEECDNLRDACRWPTTEADARECAVMYLEDHLSWQGDARVIRIVRARPTPSEAAAEVLRDLVAYTDFLGGTLTRIQARARRVLAASGPDPMPVLREARTVLALCTTGRHVRTAPEYAIVKRIGSEVGYGALMSAASAAWAEKFDGTPQAGAQHTSGPAERTVQRALAAIDRVLAGVK